MPLYMVVTFNLGIDLFGQTFRKKLWVIQLSSLFSLGETMGNLRGPRINLAEVQDVVPPVVCFAKVCHHVVPKIHR